jgi:GxxExxY protein
MQPIAELRDEQTYAIIGAAMAVHTELGYGFLEAVYQEALAREFDYRKIENRREVSLPILYRGQVLTASYRADFVCFSSLLVELKALQRLSSTEEAQVINYFEGVAPQEGLTDQFWGQELGV